MTLVLFALSMRRGVHLVLHGTLQSCGADLALRAGQRGARANDTEYGLAAYIYTRDLARGMRVAATIETGMIALSRQAQALRRQEIGD